MSREQIINFGRKVKGNILSYCMEGKPLHLLISKEMSEMSAYFGIHDCKMLLWS